MKFEEYYRHYAISWGSYRDTAKHAWDCASKVQEKRIKLLEKRVIDLQGHDDLRYIDKQLSNRE